jgi:hypothetical protein
MTGLSKCVLFAPSGAAIFPRRSPEDGFRTNTHPLWCIVGIEVGGHHERPHLPKLGPSLLIASALILAIRTARWTATHDAHLSNKDLETEIDYSIALAQSVLSKLLSRNEAIFPQRNEPWYQANDKDIPK